MPKLQLPQGHFLLRAETGDLRKEVTLKLGTRETEFRQAVAKMRKEYAGAIWHERLKIFQLSRNLVQALRKAPVGSPWHGKGFASLLAVKKTNGANYIFFDTWWEMRDILTSARERVTPELVVRAEKLNDQIARFSVWHSK
jgi:hypothetical protein